MVELCFKKCGLTANSHWVLIHNSRNSFSILIFGEKFALLELRRVEKMTVFFFVLAEEKEWILRLDGSEKQQVENLTS